MAAMADIGLRKAHHETTEAGVTETDYNEEAQQECTPFQVLLLKDESIPCKYQTALAPRGGEVLYCPVLSFEFVSGAEGRVQAALQAASNEGKEVAVVVTSPRSAEVAARAVPLEFQPQPDQWFAVGEETATRLGRDDDSIQGAQSGSAQVLLPEIKAWFAEKEDSRQVIFLCGNLRRDTIPNGLKEAGIPMVEIEVYRTIPDPNPDLPPSWTTTAPGEHRFVVFFSPSGVSCISNLPTESSLASDVRIVAIGKTSAASLEADAPHILEKASQESLLVCAKPSPDGLLAVIQESLSES